MTIRCSNNTDDNGNDDDNDNDDEKKKTTHAPTKRSLVYAFIRTYWAANTLLPQIDPPEFSCVFLLLFLSSLFCCFCCLVLLTFASHEILLFTTAVALLMIWEEHCRAYDSMIFYQLQGSVTIWWNELNLIDFSLGSTFSIISLSELFFSKEFHLFTASSGQLYELIKSSVAVQVVQDPSNVPNWFC